MSGHKHTTVVIDEKEYRRLHEAEMRLRFMQDRVPQMIAEIKQRSSENLAAQLHDLERRQGRFHKIVEGLNENIFAVEIHTSEMVNEQEQEFIRHFNELVGNLWRSAHEDIDHKVQALGDRISELQRSRNLQLERIERDFRQITANENHKRGYASQWLGHAEGIIEFIQSNYDPRFIPAEFDRLIPRMAQARQNYTSGFYESALLSAQQIYTQSADIRLIAEKNDLEWQVYFHFAFEKTQAGLQKAQCNLECRAIDLQGKDLPVRIIVDDWVNGQLGELITQLEEIEELLTFHSETLDIGSMKRLTEHTLQEIDNQIDELVFTARKDVINSQIRINIADLVFDTLLAQGYHLDSASYQDGDMRGPYCLKASNIAGNEVEITVEPIQDNLGNQTLHIRSSDNNQITEHELRERNLEITRALQERGVQVGPINNSPRETDLAWDQDPRKRALNKKRTHTTTRKTHE